MQKPKKSRERSMTFISNATVMIIILVKLLIINKGVNLSVNIKINNINATRLLYSLFFINCK